jgi:RNA polymerase sigma-70 factor (ECF subfamily)
LTDQEIKSEYEILDRAKRNPAAFEILYERYFDRIFNFIYRQTDDEELTADLCSQTFFLILKNIDRFEYRGVPVSAWFYKIAGNEVNKHFRKHKQNKIFSLEGSILRNLIEQENDGYDDVAIRRLLEFMSQLPADMIEVLQLRFYEDKDFKEIAFILDQSESAVKMRTYRALDRLRSNFQLRIKYDGKE